MASKPSLGYTITWMHLNGKISSRPNCSFSTSSSSTDVYVATSYNKDRDLHAIEVSEIGLFPRLEGYCVEDGKESFCLTVRLPITRF